ncbi:hypothetical protein BDK92_7321 [Micromonospora pisi]|uniref:ASCH domain-containing protein n=1 Tax=Micromonospora pisi TaxID=589240 RepID=A0A495JXC1_9ACTN|nr:hypothetical protein [Micromonospora pisi]RKR92839.1 hypothetical protein BDK92_7321 [Micromonospora pisi]
MAEMKAITVQQPWASCIATTAPGAKRVENRGQSTTYRGPILIHAGASISKTGEADYRCIRIWGTDPAHGRPMRAVLAVADLVDAHRAENRCCRPWGEEWYETRRGTLPAAHLVLDHVRVLDQPIPARGALGLWTPEPHLVSAVQQQLALAVTR